MALFVTFCSNIIIIYSRLTITHSKKVLGMTDGSYGCGEYIRCPTAIKISTVCRQVLHKQQQPVGFRLAQCKGYAQHITLITNV